MGSGLSRALVIGYGNVDRQDDGAAWHVLCALARRWGLRIPASLDEDFDLDDGATRLTFALQLTPELAADVAEADRVCFVDAHTGDVEQDVRVVAVGGSAGQASAFTHHTTPSMVMALAQTLYGRCPPAALVSVRGYAFGFARMLSPHTAVLIDQAAHEVERVLVSAALPV
jgi:hydrogenase maturation protease